MKKKLMILLIATLFITMMFSTGCKKKFDITGTWTINYNWTNWVSATGTITFTGNKTSGTFTNNASNTGTYTVDGNNVNWVYPSGTTYTGTSSDDNHMSGTMTGGSFHGSWTATR